MKPPMPLLVVAVLIVALSSTTQSRAQSPLVTIDTVFVGDPGNVADTTGYGAVANAFAIGKYEVTIGQYATFLNSVAASDPYGLYNLNMASNLNIAGIARSGASGSYSYSITGPSGATTIGASSPSDRPISYISWFDAARFANWINNGGTNGASTEKGAYSLNGATSGTGFARNPDATWWIPSEDEWYKAAYYKGSGTNAGYWFYPTQSDATPDNNIGGEPNQANYFAGDLAVTQSAVGDPNQNYLADIGAFTASDSAYGTFDQAGSLWEWNEAVISGDRRGRRGGAWFGGAELMQSTYRSSEIPDDPGLSISDSGFRIATVPEPSTYALLAMSAAGALWWVRRRR